MSLPTVIQPGQSILSMIQQEFPGYHPLVSIARIAHSDDADLQLRFDCHKALAKYIAPELKSVEIKAPPDTRKRVTVSLFHDEADIVDAEIKMSPENVQVGNW